VLTVCRLKSTAKQCVVARLAGFVTKALIIVGADGSNNISIPQHAFYCFHVKQPCFNSFKTMSVFSASPIVAAFACQRQQLQEDEEKARDVDDVVVVEEEDEVETKEVEVVAGGQRKRKLQQVTTQQIRIKVVKWMIEDEQATGKKGLFARTVRQFPGAFRGTVNTSCIKASRWWSDRENMALQDRENRISVNHQQHGIQKKILSKAAAGRGRKQEAWVSWLYGELEENFKRLQKAGVKFSPKLILMLAKDIMEKSTDPVCTPSYVGDAETVPVIDRIDYRWIQRFMEKNNIVGRAQTGKLMVCAECMEHIEKEIAYHLGVVALDFQSGALDENLVENADETHFVINMDNGKTLGFRGDNDVKYADVVSGGMGMTMLVRLTGGPGAII
jgi:hypothetical protein